MQLSPAPRTIMAAVLALLLTCCGSKDESGGSDAARRPAPPLTTLKLKNTGSEKPASAQVAGTQAGRPKPPLTAGPVPPGQEGTNDAPGTEAADAVSVTVTHQPDGPVLRAQGSWPGAFVSEVHVETQGTSGSATVLFATGQPPATLPLAP